MSKDGEYAALASYDAVIAKFGQVEPYVTIRAAEQRHIDALTRQLGRFGISVPVNPFLETAKAPADLTSAANAWANGEVDNVALYDRLLSAVGSDSALKRVFTNLRRASLEVHLPLFREAAAQGGTLTRAQMSALGHRTMTG